MVKENTSCKFHSCKDCSICMTVLSSKSLIFEECVLNNHYLFKYRDPPSWTACTLKTLTSCIRVDTLEHIELGSMGCLRIKPVPRSLLFGYKWSYTPWMSPTFQRQFIMALPSMPSADLDRAFAAQTANYITAAIQTVSVDSVKCTLENPAHMWLLRHGYGIY